MIVDDFITIFGEFSYNNELYARSVFHVIVGQLLKDKRIWIGGQYVDLRHSCFLIQPTASGKSAGTPVYTKLANSLEIKVNSLSKITDEALIGSVIAERIKDFSGEHTDYRKEYGLLKEHGILHFDEASTLFKESAHTKNIAVYLQQALNPLGSKQNEVSKKLTHGDKIKFNPDCSLILTTFPPEGIFKHVLNTGLFERMFLIPRTLSTKDRKSNIDSWIDRVGNEYKSEININKISKELESIAEALKDITNFEFDEDSKRVLRARMSGLIEMLSPANNKVREIMHGFVPRYGNHMLILAAHHAALEKRFVIKPIDIDYGYRMVFGALKNIMTWIEFGCEIKEKTPKEVHKWNVLVRAWDSMHQDDGQRVSFNVLRKKMISVWNCSEPTAKKYIDVFIEQKRLITRIEDKIRKVGISSKYKKVKI